MMDFIYSFFAILYLCGNLVLGLINKTLYNFIFIGEYGVVVIGILILALFLCIEYYLYVKLT